MTANLPRQLAHSDFRQLPINSSARPISNPSIMPTPMTITMTKQNRLLNTSQATITSADFASSDNDDNNHDDGLDFKTILPKNQASIVTMTTTTTTTTPSAIKSPISVKHSVIDSQTYKLTMTINRLKLSDFGEYTCIAINSNGQSDASVIIDCKYCLIYTRFLPQIVRSV